jgi:hypothetical protein
MHFVRGFAGFAILAMAVRQNASPHSSSQNLITKMIGMRHPSAITRGYRPGATHTTAAPPRLSDAVTSTQCHKVDQCLEIEHRPIKKRRFQRTVPDAMRFL